MNNPNSEVFSNLMVIFNWFTNLVYLNILWMIGCLMGLIFLGFGPATIGLFDTLKQYVWKKNAVEIRQHFFSVYRKEWKKINTWIFLVYGIVLFFWIDYRLIDFFSANHIVATIVYPVFIILFLLIFLTILYFFVFYTTFEVSIFKLTENSLLLALSNPGRSFSIILFFIAYYNLLIRWPFIIGVFFVSLPAVFVILILKKLYFKIIWAQKKEKK